MKRRWRGTQGGVGAPASCRLMTVVIRLTENQKWNGGSGIRPRMGAAFRHAGGDALSLEMENRH